MESLSEHVSWQDREGKRAQGGYSMTDGDCICVCVCQCVNEWMLGESSGLFLHRNKWRKDQTWCPTWCHWWKGAGGLENIVLFQFHLWDGFVSIFFTFDIMFHSLWCLYCLHFILSRNQININSDGTKPNVTFWLISGLSCGLQRQSFVRLSLYGLQRPGNKLTVISMAWASHDFTWDQNQ